MTTVELPITGSRYGTAGQTSWTNTTTLYSGFDDGSNGYYRSRIAISTAGLTIARSSRLVLRVKINNKSSPVGLECILTQNNSLAPNECQNSNKTAASTKLNNAALDRSYAYADSGCTTVLDANTGMNMASGSKFYLLFENVQIQQDQTYYLYFVRNHRDGYTGSGFVRADVEDIVPTLSYTNFTACTAPTVLTATPEVYESQITLNWSGAVAGDNNEITGYQIRVDHSNDLETWDGWEDLTEVTEEEYSYLPENDRGTYLRFSVRALGAAGEEYYSPWFIPEGLTVKKNSCPATPMEFRPVDIIIPTGSVVQLKWDEGFDPDYNLAGYTVGRQIDGEWVETDNGLNTSFSETRNGVAGEVMQYAVRAYDQLGAVSEWAYSENITFNSPPSTPTAVQLDKSEYSPGDVVNVSWGDVEDVDGNLDCFELGYIVEGTDELIPLASVNVIDVNSPEKSYSFVPAQLEYHQKMRIAVCAKDTFGAVSDWVYSDPLCRNDRPHIHIFENKIPGNFVPKVAGNRYMPYIRNNGKWIRHPGAR